jgi:hypothetical protein
MKTSNRRVTFIAGALIAIGAFTAARIAVAAPQVAPQEPVATNGQESRITLRQIDVNGESLVELSRDGQLQTAYRFIVTTEGSKMDVTPHRGNQVLVRVNDLELLTSGIVFRADLLKLKITARTE